MGRAGLLLGQAHDEGHVVTRFRFAREDAMMLPDHDGVSQSELVVTATAERVHIPEAIGHLRGDGTKPRPAPAEADFDLVALPCLDLDLRQLARVRTCLL
jgi:hypothetical protein